MKVFFSLIIFSLLLATCQGQWCIGSYSLSKDDNKIPQRTCADIYDGKRHLIVSTWKTAHCFSCECTQLELQCCEKYSGDAKREGCITVANPETCQYDHRCAEPQVAAVA